MRQADIPEKRANRFGTANALDEGERSAAGNEAGFESKNVVAGVNMTTLLIIGGIWLMVSLAFCLALGLAARKPLPGVPASNDLSYPVNFKPVSKDEPVLTPALSTH